MVNQQHGGNRWVSAVIPALLIHISIGTVYCWSVFKQLIAYFAAIFAVLMLVTYVPQISLALPSLMGYVK